MDYIFYPNLKKEFPIIVKGEGIYLWDNKGKKYIDACSGALVSNIGHGVDEVIEAIYEQMKKVEFAHRFKFSNEKIIELSEKIIKISPKEISRVLFASGGSEAVETALKLAREYYVEKGKPTKYKVISRWQSYHGNTMGALSLSGNVARRVRYSPLLLDFPHAEPAYCYRCSFDKNPDECNLECAENIEKLVKREGPENIAAIIIEPIVGSTLGAAVPKDGYLQYIRELCDKYDILFIADEVMTGVGRTGKNFAVDHWKVIPDVICMAKGISGGYAPLGAVAIKESIYEVFKKGSGKFAHGYTFAGNPVSAAAGCAVIDYLNKNNLIEKCEKSGDLILNKLEILKEKYPFIGDVRGKGLMMGIEFVKNKRTKETFDPSLGLTERIVDKALEEGLMLYGAALCADGTKGDAVMVAPPLTVTEIEINEIIKILEKVIKDVFESIKFWE
ncbi:aspartate aminotransferase family protein [Thermovenabulum gondwanense]|uniref:Putative aminotransferase n=1 Tax=Thermovenabulum gondwanense TaxID=520767 RepID=A0A162N081_9FIRM|nr:aspartate aminotransferase family protein [Thermovenabulum gondwanense]KYO68621.1 putative aminotransferase [Thermovenabulum gondwanense]